MVLPWFDSRSSRCVSNSETRCSIAKSSAGASTGSKSSSRRFDTFADVGELRTDLTLLIQMIRVPGPGPDE